MAEWQKAKFTVIPEKSLKPINDKLEEAIVFLETLEEGLNVLGDLVSILKLIESLVQDFFGFLLGGIIDDFNRMIDDFRYTGIYALDLTTHNWIGPTIKVKRQPNDIVANFAAGKNVSNIEFTAPKIPFTKVGGKKANLNNTAFDWLAYYKRQTYREWLRVLIDALRDENDLPSFQAYNDKITGKESLNKTTAQTEMGELQEHPYEMKYFRPGRPNFGPNGHLECYVFAVAFPDILTFLQTLGALSKVFYQLTDLSEYEEMIDAFKRAAEKARTGFISDVAKDSLLPSEYANIRGTPPDFIGLSAGQIFQPLFKLLENLTKKLKSLFKTTSTGLSDFLEATIEALRTQIEELRDIIRVLKQLIQLLADLLNLNGVYMLHISTDGGVEGLIGELQAATGFKGDERNRGTAVGSNNPKLYLGGAMFCYGYPSTEDKYYNLSEAWQKRKDILTSKQTDVSKQWKRGTDALGRLFK